MSFIKMLSFETIWFPFITFRAIYKIILKENKKLPSQIYSLFRGVLGKNLRNISCVLRSVKSCIECKLNYTCPYGYMFETVRPPHAQKLRKYPYLPHPFCFSIPYPLENDHLFIDFCLVGRGIKFYPHFVLSLQMIDENFQSKEIEKLELISILNPLNNKPLLSSDNLETPHEVNFENFIISKVSEIQLKIISPLELKYQEKRVTSQNFDFSILIRNLLRRISALSYFHSQKEINLDFKKIIENSKKVEIIKKDLKEIKIKRKSHRTGQTHPLCGLIGEVYFRGDLENFYPLLVLGQFVQVGKHTSFGFGKYEIKF